MRVFGIDPSLRSTGFGAIESDGHRFAAIEFGRIRSPAGEPHGDALARLATDLGTVIDRCAPDAIAIESLFYCRNVRTAITLGEARGAVLLTAARAGFPVVEYAPTRVKKALTGRGSATKEQVALLVRRILGIADDVDLPDDASDALAIAICHVHHASAPRVG